MATLKIINNAEVTMNGRTITIKHGDADDNIKTALEFTVTGRAHQVDGSVNAAAVATVYDADDDLPATSKYLIAWADQDVWWQFISASSNFQIPMRAKTCVVLSSHSAASDGIGFVAVANTTAITGGTEPTIQALNSVIIGNYNASDAANYVFAVFGVTS